MRCKVLGFGVSYKTKLKGNIEIDLLLGEIITFFNSNRLHVHYNYTTNPHYKAY